MSYSLFTADGTPITTGYFTATESDGREAIWFGADVNDPNREFIGWADTLAKAHKLIDRLQQADRLNDSYGVVLWKTEDVADKYGITHEEAAEYLDNIGGRLVDAQTMKGWDIIDFWRDEMPDARTEEQKEAWEKAQEDAEERQKTSQHW